MAPTQRSDTVEKLARWERQERTRDGAEYRIRPMRHDDGERERQFIEGLSERSRYERTMGLRRVPSTKRIEELVHVDYKNRMAFVATVDDAGAERFIGITRYIRGTDHECEFAVAVADEWQGHGIGAALMQTLIAYARAHSISALDGVISATNSRMIALARRMGMTLRLNESDRAIFDAVLTLEPSSDH
jgi:acetyltransferase